MEETSTECEHVTTLAEYIDGLEAEELEADLLFGGDKGTECTYSKGYMQRQAVFACRTCTPDGNAGFCVACLDCHNGHEVIELWTRRKFRCNCGNSKFGGDICKLCGDKEPENPSNFYSQNYRGVYCTCQQSFTGPDETEQGEMLQCCICEDWFHEDHLGLPASLQVPRDEEGEPTFGELVCPACVPRCSFLSKYPQLLVPPILADIVTEALPLEAPKQITSTGSNAEECSGRNVSQVLSQDNEFSIAAEPTCGLVKENLSGGMVDCKLERPTDGSHNRESNGDSSFGSLNKEQLAGKGPAIFLGKSWRSQLCQCITCLKTYEVKEIKFLLDKGDTLQEYEAVAQQKRQEATEGSIEELMQKLDHVQRMELLYGLNDLASKLKSFLTGFEESGQTVTSADIYEFFEKLKKKRHRLY